MGDVPGETHTCKSEERGAREHGQTHFLLSSAVFQDVMEEK